MHETIRTLTRLWAWARDVAALLGVCLLALFMPSMYDGSGRELDE